MEMVVVLAILAALAAIVVPLFPNLLRRAHKATDATQTAEMAKMVQLYQSLYYGYPADFDSLVDSGGAFPGYLPNDGGAVFGGFVTTSTLSAEEAAALKRVGITTLQPLSTAIGAGQHPTMNPYPAGSTLIGNRQTVAAGITVTILDNAAIWGAGGKNPSFLQAAYASDDPAARYVVFGVGPRCSMVGKVMQDAPQSVPQTRDLTPATHYCRIGVIFKISGNEVNITERARFIAAVAMEDDELEQTDKDISGYYDVANAP